MTDDEFDLLVMIARASIAERANPAGKLQSSLALDVLALLRGDEARGAAAGAWLVLVQQEAEQPHDTSQGATRNGCESTATGERGPLSTSAAVAKLSDYCRAGCRTSESN